MNCPFCKGKASLKSESYEGIEIDRCSKCKGIWLDNGELTKIVRIREAKFADSIIQKAMSGAFTGVPDKELRSLELCPKCNSAMEAMNYNYSSGIVIDRCPNDHGIWLNERELELIQAHREKWESEEAASREDWLSFVNSVADKNKSTAQKKRKSKLRPDHYVVDSLLRKLFSFLNR